MTIRNSNLDMLKQLIQGLSEAERNELLTEMLSNEPSAALALSPASSQSIVETAVHTLAGLDFTDYGLDERQFLFCLEYAQNGFNGAAAYRTVFDPKMSLAVSRAAAARLRNSPKIVEFLEVLFDKLLISNAEVQLRLVDMLNVSMEDFIAEDGNSIDLATAKALGAMRGVQRLRRTEHGWDIQLYDRVKMLDVLTRVRGMQKTVKITADLDKMAEEFDYPAEDLHEIKRQMKEKLKLDLIAGKTGGTK